MLTHSFNPQDFDADAIASLAKEAGMKYIVITSKHHEGFCLWDSKYTNFDVSNTPFKRNEVCLRRIGTPEQFHPDSRLNHVWEACYTMNKSWGYKSNDEDWKSPETLYDKLKDINGKDRNLLLNIGPDGEGKVDWTKYYPAGRLAGSTLPIATG